MIVIGFLNVISISVDSPSTASQVMLLSKSRLASMSYTQDVTLYYNVLDLGMFVTSITLFVVKLSIPNSPLY